MESKNKDKVENISRIKSRSEHHNTHNESSNSKKNESNLVFQDTRYKPENNTLILSTSKKNQENYIKLLSYPVGVPPYSTGLESLAFQTL
ncbi:hypothetical protein AYI69_g1646 [Smittium culicis]|uniref:Uncharacterized protein n=1 Tax=Smittium culicis TaxID=133412 RepID=A0A1R1YPM5_9FUNG|nr:hypothetical protein AYI69_g1646 [Smittium culicis]